MSTLVPIRSLARSQKFDIGSKTITPNKTTYVNVDGGRSLRDLARHTTLGSFLQVGPSFFQGDDGTVDGGGVVKVQATGLIVDISAVRWTNAAKVSGNAAVGTATVTTADATNPRIDVVVVDTTSGAFSVIAGTATANAAIAPTRPGIASTFLAGVPAIAANKIALAYILVPATAVNLLQTNVLDVRP